VTVVVPIGNVLPLAGLQTGATAPLTRSEAVTANETATLVTLIASAATDGGADTAGGVVSRTVTATDPLLLFPDAAVALHRTPVTPIGNRLPGPPTAITWPSGRPR